MLTNKNKLDNLTSICPCDNFTKNSAMFQKGKLTCQYIAKGIMGKSNPKTNPVLKLSQLNLIVPFI